MAYQIQLPEYKGPLGLLLELIEKEELDITKVSLAKVSDQFLAYIEKAKEIGPEELADFLVVAAKLLLIKSRILLPTLFWEEEEGEDLETQLKIFKEYYQAAKVLGELALKENFTFSRQKFPSNLVGSISVPLKIKARTLANYFQTIARAIEEKTKLSQGTIKKLKTLTEKIKELKEFFLKKKETGFVELARSQSSRAEVILSFLALLELAKQRMVALSQPRLFEDIVIMRIKHTNS